MPSRNTIEVQITATDDAGKVLTQFGKTVEDVGKKTDGVNSRLASLSAGFSSFGEKAAKVGAVMSVGVTAPLAALGKASIDAASDLNESMSKMQVVFGESSSVVAEFARSAAKNLGMSQQAALEATGTFGNLFTSMGMGKQPAADMSMAVVQLASDLASFNNLDPSEVLEKLRSGLVGETEPLRSLGVNLSAAEVQAKAMAMGLANAAGELDNAALIQARYALILEQTKNAQGDFARTSDGLANSTRIAKAQFEDMQATLGTKLLPIAIQATGTLTKMLDAFTSLPPGVQGTVVAVGALLAVAGPLTTVIGGLAAAVGVLTSAQTLNTAALIAGKAATVASTVAQWALNAALTANPIGLVVVALAALAAGLIYAYQHSETFRAIVDGLAGSLVDMVRNGLEFGQRALQWFDQALTAVGDTANWLGRTVLGWLTDRINDVGRAIQWLLDKVNELLSKLPQISLPQISLPEIALPHLAAGTPYFPGGLAMVGERGPELVNLPRGAAVIPTASAPSAAGNSVTINGPLISGVVVQSEADEDRLARKIWAMLTDDRDVTLSAGVA